MSKTQGTGRRLAVVRCYLTEGEKRTVTAMARAARLSESDFVRLLLTGATLQRTGAAALSSCLSEPYFVSATNTPSQSAPGDARR